MLCPTSETSQTSRKSVAGKVKAGFTKPVERPKRWSKLSHNFFPDGEPKT